MVQLNCQICDLTFNSQSKYSKHRKEFHQVQRGRVNGHHQQKFYERVLERQRLMDEVERCKNMVTYTGCPIDMLTHSDQILKIEKSHMPISKPCFKILK